MQENNVLAYAQTKPNKTKACCRRRYVIWPGSDVMNSFGCLQHHY